MTIEHQSDLSIEEMAEIVTALNEHRKALEEFVKTHPSDIFMSINHIRLIYVRSALEKVRIIVDAYEAVEARTSCPECGNYLEHDQELVRAPNRDFVHYDCYEDDPEATAS